MLYELNISTFIGQMYENDFVSKTFFKEKIK